MSESSLGILPAQRYAVDTAAATLPITIDEVKDYCRMTGSSDFDKELELLIGAATNHIQEITGRQLVTATLLAYFDEFPQSVDDKHWMELRKPPVQSVSSITYTDTNGDTQTWSSANYQVDAGTKNTPARIRPAFGQTWPVTRADTFRNITVTFLAGFGAQAAVPQEYKYAIALLAHHWFINREPIGSTKALSFSLENLITSFTWDQP